MVCTEKCTAESESKSPRCMKTFVLFECLNFNRKVFLSDIKLRSFSTNPIKIESKIRKKLFVDEKLTFRLGVERLDETVDALDSLFRRDF